ncbi:ribosome biogenesis GTP-binding protein YihA/YsxC [Schwartzia succinivorans]|jgi:GTP-binding protein|uniref:Probable GTP-binding protein EngB n=1 Tax=Schwartzia succinivorans DSM 10502 TaxID=1123243 RepID=A0A1M4TQT8_9FIRM|nr:ribosome biogenesis GTP-binding protein YihA/YsxC [Schwartzia succinivorans]MBE6098408.1 YihA family ribosome biogenesis GTP-binding protein [Schwartzia succinivorans]MBQ5414100.1 YihA family ribosome biogenesis GTP-binding protein [Schwartzia sp. (in: firmicutes)]MCR5446142.1 ribosome biogenesis GTP-binding protein YihA/YsxC [Schwartzia sp. (in: firmicutes)]SHE46879.1 GTP-binding protein [Schwartzia succinivorans DSM 10502]
MMEQKKERVVVTKGAYLTSAVKKEQYPEVKRPEFVFIGRSNVGKSSLINSLTRVTNLARVSRQPGKTQTINYFEVGLKIDGSEERTDFYLVDLPGYGYAKTGKENRKIWKKFIDEYLLNSESIQFVCQLIDIRHDPMQSDIDMFRWLVTNGLPVLVIATKTDKLSRSAAQKQIARMKQVLGVPELDILPYSSLKNEGRSELLDSIATSLIK